ncbi:MULTISPECIES: pentapeptide repeat-containing protein [unclassified Microcystis]|uniref:pentapeptide repeat-containing protein n=1 Tax=unclassified Microcystis TaxID=2643300 RepID=UPI00258BCB7E|nr:MULTISPECIES: pentapeptide repeat-containing protein [unclassified Microcystis]MCA2761467.1 pentapeptide repeat-containing protein [Microcystis sp. M151S2]NCR88251.1 pentapeptide repeat-containing protein [Microcystis aeruginosa G13-10]NCS33095.1 pentapeptide repeat-containing protein [Microcystis aeruginosa G11-01]MCA2641355.1 pentapeptide repeat-containing protein [Microcystis sp. M087S2]MCA2671673.1 pentapeptide repeat-containing protein [Microcystis sp. M080S2]
MTASEIARLIIRIEETVNPDSEYYGKLVKWWEQEKELWHYGIGLSNTHFFNIGTIEAKELQILKRHDIIEHDIIEHRNLDIRGVPGIYSPFESDEIIERLKYSLRWLNDLPENSSKKKINGKALAFLIFTDDEAGTDKDREPIDIDFASYLKQQSPQLKHNIIRDFFEKGKNWVYIFLGIFIFWIVFAIALISGESGSDQPWIKWLLSGALISLPVIIISTWISNFKWSGFQKKSFWDWLQLLIVPLILAFGAVYLNSVSETIAKDGEQQELLKDYFSKMQTLIVETKKSKDSQPKIVETKKSVETTKSKDSQPNPDGAPLLPEFIPIAEALTFAVLDQLDGKRKGKVITYLADSKLITANIKDKDPKPVIDLKNANLKKIKIDNLDMNGQLIDKDTIQGVIIRGADMTNANLEKVYLTYSDLTGSDLSNATLTTVDLTGAKMESVKLIKTDIKDITISPQTDLNNACYLEGQEPQVQQNNKDKSSKLSLLQLLKNNNNDSKMLPIKSGEDCKRPLSEDEKG